MVTLREIIEDLARIGVTLLSWGYGLFIIVFLLLRLVISDRFWLIGGISNFTFYCFLPLIPLVLLTIPARAKWGLLTTVPLLIVGMLLFGSYFLPKNVPPPTGQTIKVLTLNIYRNNNTLLETQNYMRGIKADFVLLQEMPERQVLPLLYGMSDFYPYQSSRAGVDATSSNILLSRYPILTVEDLQQPNDTHTQQRYIVLYEGQQIALYNIDLALPVGTPRLSLIGGIVGDFAFGYEDSQRNAEIRRLITRIQQQPLPFIVAGDFAMTDQTTIYREVTNVMRDSFREVGTGLGGSWPVGEVEGLLPKFIPPLLRVDYIWHSDHFRAIEASLGDKIGSDHLPLYATLELAVR
ncbi:MAG: endonuclease/exonuclease/phosphatase family protein [Anaerolineae bacterium]|nr:endonuclease/exonuclease/phosphatase family protein [Anaerolineae bacterium]